MTQQLAFVFPGQGSQKTGMLAELAAEYSLIGDTFGQASEVLDYDLWALAQGEDQEAINQTEVTQPLLLTASTALWRLWQEKGGEQPLCVAGHSLGEWSALVAAGVLDFADAVRLVQLRGRYMQEAVPAGRGSMAAIMGLDDKTVEQACQGAAGDEFVAPVNYNAPGQVVIAGNQAAVERAIEACKDAGAKRALPLPVSAPFHTPLMAPAAMRLAEEISATDLRTPQITVIHNVGVDSVEDPAEVGRRMVEQITAPVPWVACVRALASRGVDTLVECGPGQVLSGLNKRIEKRLTTLNIDTPAGLRSALNAGETS